MEVIDLRLKGLKLIKPKVFKDPRGFFLESFKQPLYEKMGIQEKFAQDNHSFSTKHCIRGMHFQSFPGQAKLVRVAVGKVYDVAVDIRPDSPTYGQWEAVVLDDQEHHQLFIPVGFAHGFCVLSEEAHVMYKVSTPYDPVHEKGFRWNDPQINIQWPTQQPIVSERDQQAPSFKDLPLHTGR
ncbi:dTDP-4-dehydrorhamnose 3,5-epimerase [Candidatus Protochlamydia phocaeensis]|uniref:dTDP-4-dehydrorhamnose 3,5-epimerase n=1 Tax=Candidatus Protochlamydia phocaeensis TaxID=1414722 RepID=UPI000838B1EC|nr:dTDP-4-dehydrorhamnose 3,5-epimerase [Candidatus Protochlamydia phocaeensis]